MYDFIFEKKLKMTKGILSKILFFYSFFWVNVTFSQSDLSKGIAPSIQSPNYAKFKKHNAPEINMFNGRLNLSIPIFNIKNGMNNVDLSIAYNSDGNKPDEHPSWVGLNWNLNVGGYIKRITNSHFDEYYDSNLREFYNYNNQRAILTNREDWNTSNNLLNKDIDAAPDEFIFNVGEYSGSFYLNHLGEWEAKIKDNFNIKIESEINNDYTLIGGAMQIVRRLYTKFTITTPDGTKYVFGENPNAIELSLPVFPSLHEWYNVDPNGPDPIGGPDVILPYQTQASAWYLSKIVSPDNRVINFNYDRGWNFRQITYSQISKDGWVNQHQLTTGDINQNSKFLIATSYLKEIQSDNGDKVVFKRSISNELDWTVKVKPLSQDNISSGLWKYYKLDNIKLYNNNTLIKDVDLSYIEHPQERLKLNSIIHKDVVTGQEGVKYSFYYKAKLLPNYNEGLVDHWGFYNGKNYWNGVSSQSNIGQSDILPVNLNDYYISREPDSNYMDAEIIEKIVYPTGGYTILEFEPHTYSKFLNYSHEDITLSSLNSPKIAGGLRVKKINLLDSLNNIIEVKEYYYQNNYINSGTQSSGVLKNLPIYYESFIWPIGQKYSKFSSNPLNDINSLESHVTYSEVTEKTVNGYNVYSFSNHDNGFKDVLPFATSGIHPNASRISRKIFGSRELERGLTLNKKVFNQNKTLLSEVINEYNNDPNRYNKYIRSINRGTFVGVDIIDLAAIPIYNFHPYLKKQVSKEYFNNNTEIFREISFTYDNKYQLVRNKTFVSSDGVQIKESFKYPFDFETKDLLITQDDYLNGIKYLNDNNMTESYVEKIVTKNINGQEFIIDGELRLYKLGQIAKIKNLELDFPLRNDLFVNSSLINNSFVHDNRYKDKIKNIKYNDKGNIIEIELNNKQTEVFLWAYNNSYLVGSLKNSNISDLTSIFSENRRVSLENSFDNSFILNELKYLKESLTNADVKIYTHKPYNGIIEEFFDNSYSKKFNYDGLSRLTEIKSGFEDIEKVYFYNNKKFARLHISEKNIDFGNVEISIPSTKYLKLHNEGNLLLNLKNVSITPPFTYVLQGDNNIIAGNYKNIEVGIQSNQSGIHDGNLSIVTNDDKTHNINLKANVSGSKIISLSGNIDFGTLYPINGTYGSRQMTLVISNLGTDNLVISNINCTSIFQVNWQGVIPPSQSVSVSVYFNPIMPGFYQGELEVISNKSSGNSKISIQGNAAF